MLHETPRKRGPEKGSKRRGWGRLRKLKSGRWQASYTGPDSAVYKAASTFDTEDAARGWLNEERRLIDRGDWMPPELRGVPAHLTRAKLFRDYSAEWVDNRRTKGRPLKPRTRSEYERLLESELLPAFGDLPLNVITKDAVKAWHDGQGRKTATQTARAYSLLRTILATAIEDGHISVNPCTIRGAGSTTRRHEVKPLTVHELGTLVEEMPEKYQLLILLASWCALRFGELVELRRKDIDVKNARIRVRRGAVRVDGEVIVDTPKSEAGARDVAIPPHLLETVKAHLSEHAAPGTNGLVFPATNGGQLAPSTVYGKNPRIDGGEVKGGTNFYRARVIAGHPTLRFHDLRHTGAVLAAQSGATLAELMNRLGHSTPQAAMRYQHAAADRDREIAARLSLLAASAE